MLNNSNQSTPPAEVHYYDIRYVFLVCFVSAMGGLLFGYDWVVIGGAKTFYEEYFGLTTSFQIGWAISSAVVGCLFGALVSGTLSDKYGRKKLLLLSGFLFLWSAVGTGLVNTFSYFVIYRLIGGVGMGMASGLSPLYISEISPAPFRGRLVSFNQLTIVIGVLAAQVVNWLIAQPVPQDATAEQILNSWNGQYGWRWMFWAEAVPAVLFFILMFLVPESPRWLVKNGQDEAAQRIMTRIGGVAYAAFEVSDIKQTLVNEIQTVKFRDLLEPKMLKILMLGVFLAMLQQWCGVNVAFQYAEEVFEAAGYGVSDMLFNIVISGSIMLLFTLLALKFVDKAGRKTLLLAGCGGLTILYALLGVAFFNKSTGLHIVMLIMGTVACYSFSLAPCVWVVLAEIFPNCIRGAAMSVSVFSLWLANMGLTFTFPVLNEALGTAVTFWFYGVICLIGFGVITRFLPETKSKTLEEIERQMVD